MRVGARAGVKAGDRGRIAPFRALSIRGGSFPHGARASDSGRRTTVERGTRSDPDAIGDHIPWREQAAEQQRARHGQPESVEPGECTSRNSSTPMAITAAITAISGRGRREVAIATRKKTIVPHSPEPPYFTTNGRPSPSPYRRKAKPQTITAMQRQARAIDQTPSRFPASTDRGALLRHGKASATGNVSSKLVPRSDSTQPDRAAMGVEHGANDGQAHSGAAAVAPGGEEAVEDLGRGCWARRLRRRRLTVTSQPVVLPRRRIYRAMSCRGARRCRRDWKK